MPPRMDPVAKAPSVSEVSSWRGRPLREYSPLFGRLPASHQPHVSLDGDTYSVVHHGTARSQVSIRPRDPSYRSIQSPMVKTDEESQRLDELFDVGEASIWSSSVSLVKSILGIGLVSMPYICSQIGWIAYFVALAVFALPSHFANLCLAYSVDIVLGPWDAVGSGIVERADYLTLGVIAFGSKGQWYILALFLIVIWGGCVSLLIAMNDILLGYTKGHAPFDDPWFMSFVLCIFVFPLCLLDSLNALRHTSYFGILGIACLAGALGYWAVHEGHSISELRKADINPSTPTLLSVFVFSYMGQFNFIRIYSELSQRTPARVNVVSAISLFSSYAFYCAVGLCGYLAFTENVSSKDVLVNLHGNDGLATHLPNVLFCASLFLTMPVYMFEARNMVEDMLSAVLDTDAERQALLDEEATMVGPLKKLPRRIGVVSTLFISTIVVAVLYPNVTSVLGLLGASTSTTMMCVLPPLFLLRISRFAKCPLSARMTWACRIFLALGLILIPFLSGITIHGMLVSGGDDGSDAPAPNATAALP
eukprot:TRINITY_DN32478_c0_g1_i1.p1 TRINITY_DN32478_c0_g1~~TRINITY_DN32478_c0_g1_i1.p1  ORF type:complete len:535 (+),score=186.84 TRINITY_DN32478_c0_g1_i1:57-1661(+)